jgi:predicted transposase YbfD/YdcC
VEKKEGELTAAPGLLAQLNLKGRVVAGGAFYAQKDLSHQVVELDDDCCWVVKDNQPTLRADIALLFAQPSWGEEVAAVAEQGRHGDRLRHHQFESQEGRRSGIAAIMAGPLGIENRLHYVRDVAMKEDASPVRSG